MDDREDELRHNTDMADFVEAALRLASKVGIRRAARAMDAAGVPMRVIARVPCDTDQRRPCEPAVPH